MVSNQNFNDAFKTAGLKNLKLCFKATRVQPLIDLMNTGEVPKDLIPENDGLPKRSYRGTKCLSLWRCLAMVYKHRLGSNLSQFV